MNGTLSLNALFAPDTACTGTEGAAEADMAMGGGLRWIGRGTLDLYGPGDAQDPKTQNKRSMMIMARALKRPGLRVVACTRLAPLRPFLSLSSALPSASHTYLIMAFVCFELFLAPLLSDIVIVRWTRRLRCGSCRRSLRTIRPVSILRLLRLLISSIMQRVGWHWYARG